MLIPVHDCYRVNKLVNHHLTPLPSINLLVILWSTRGVDIIVWFSGSLSKSFESRFGHCILNFNCVTFACQIFQIQTYIYAYFSWTTNPKLLYVITSC